MPNVRTIRPRQNRILRYSGPRNIRGRTRAIFRNGRWHASSGAMSWPIRGNPRTPGWTNMYYARRGGR